MNEIQARLDAALADRYRIERAATSVAARPTIAFGDVRTPGLQSRSDNVLSSDVSRGDDVPSSDRSRRRVP